MAGVFINILIYWSLGAWFLKYVVKSTTIKLKVVIYTTCLPRAVLEQIYFKNCLGP